MKKFICLILSALLCYGSTTIYAEPNMGEAEVIMKEAPSEPIKRAWTGKEFTYRSYNEETRQCERFISNDGFQFTKLPLPPEIAEKEYLIWSDGYYIAFDGRGMVPDNHIYTTHTTAPYYVLDENFNLIKQVDYMGRIIKYTFDDGMFYYVIQKRVVDHSYMSNYPPSDFHYIFCKTPDHENVERVEIAGRSEELENMLPSMLYVKREKKNEIPFTGANIYKLHDDTKYSFDGIYVQSVAADIEGPADRWYIDGYLYIETENAYYKIKTDRPKQTYVKLNGAILAFEQPPVVEDGRTLVPMRFLFECLGDKVTWDEETQSVTAENENNKIVFRIGDTAADVNGIEQTMDVSAKLIGDKTYVPLRFLSENLGYTVTWDEETSTASIVSDPAKITQNTDIQCTINGLWVESFAIGGNQYIPIAVLPNYGFSVTYTMWGEYAIERDLNADIVGCDVNKGKANGGMNVSNVQQTEVLLNGKEANAYMANNRIVMQADELLVFGSGGYNPETRCFEIELK